MVDCFIVGAGASGLFAAGLIGKNRKVILCDKNKVLGRKLLITGKGRCNVTNNCDNETLLKNVRNNSSFLYSAFSRFSSADTISFFESLGVKLKTERGNRVFPVSDKASDIRDALVKNINRKNVNIVSDEVLNINKNEEVFTITMTNGGFYTAKTLLIATGGKSYPLTGSTGDGYRFAGELGHTVTEIKPSLVPIVIKEADFCKRLQGLSLKNTGMKVFREGKEVCSDFGELLFTHFGLSGPIVLSCSAYVNKGDIISIDLKPALDEKHLDSRILSDFSKNLNKNFSNALSDLLPLKMIPVIIERSGISPFEKVNSITKKQRSELVSAIKKFGLTVEGLRPVSEAIITSGGVSIREVNAKTMESKIIGGLYWAGEVLDLDAYTGGFNLQIAFSTANAAAQAIEQSL